MSKYDVEDRNISFLGQKAKYSGQYSSKRYEPEGYGTAVMENGDTFKGKFHKGEPLTGRYTYENGSYIDIYYEFVWFTKMTRYYTHYDAGYYGYKKRDNRPDQKETYDNGYYVGQMKNGKRDGIGTYYWKSGAKYTGGWKNGGKHGVGKYIYSDGDEYWYLYDNDVNKHTLYEPDHSSSSSYSSYSYESNDYDDEPSYSSDDDDGPSQAIKDAQDRAIAAFNSGDYETADREVRFINNSGYGSQLTVSDEFGHEENMSDFQDEIEDIIKSQNEEDDDEYEDE